MKVNKGVFHHLLAGTYRQFSAPFWQLWKISKKGRKTGKKRKQTKKNKAKMIIQEKYMATKG